MTGRLRGTAALLVLVVACTTGGTTTTGAGQPTTSPTTSTTSPRPSTSTTATTVTTTTTATTVPADPVFTYFVVAEEQSSQLAVIGPIEPYLNCLETGTGRCRGPAVAGLIDLGASPHNLASAGSIVFATHPYAGMMSRVDVATGKVTKTAVGVEPHDVKVGSEDVLHVADEEGRRLLTLDALTLEALSAVDLPARPHDLYVGTDEIWVTLISTDQLALVAEGAYELHSTGGSPHDLLVDPMGRVWFSNWGSAELNVYDPVTGQTSVAPAGVVEPHHFALDNEGTVWVSDNGGDSIVGFRVDTLSVEVGPVPHHLVFSGPLGVVAVSGSGEAVLVYEGRVVARIELSPGLHGVAVVTTSQPLVEDEGS